MITLRKLFISVASLLIISTVPVACDQFESDSNQTIQTEPVNAKLESRVLGRWDTLIAKNFDQAYEFFSPAYRKLFPLEHYLPTTGANVDWLSTKIKDVKFDGDRAEVTLILNYRLNLPMSAGDSFGKIGKNVNEIWLWIDGEWWYDSGNNSGGVF